MKYLLLIITIVLLTVNVSAQNVETPPQYDVEFAEEFFAKGATVEIFVSLADKTKQLAVNPNIKFNWTVSRGEIISGQGTPRIKVQTPNDNETITATVLISGYSTDIALSVTTQTPLQSPSAVLFDEFKYKSPNNGYVKARFQAFAVELNNNPVAQGYVFIRPKTPRDNLRIQKLITNYAKTIGFDSSRLTIVSGAKNTENLIKFYVVPPGATVPDE